MNNNCWKNTNFKHFFIVSFVIICLPNMVIAKFVEQIPLNTKALSLANSVTAYPPGLMSIHYNPAGLSKIGPDNLMSFSLNCSRIERDDQFIPNNDFYIASDVENYHLTFDPASSHGVYDSTANAHTTRNDRYFYIPLLNRAEKLPFTISPFPVGLTKRETGSKWTHAYALYLPQSWGYRNDSHDDASRFQCKATYQQYFAFSYALSYQLSNSFSAGVSLAFGQSSYGMISDLRLPTDQIAYILRKRRASLYGSYFEWKPALTAYNALGELELELRDDLTYSYNLGLLWEPFSMLSIGLSYQSEIERRLKGTFKVNYSKNVQGLMNILKSKNADGFEVLILNMLNKKNNVYVNTTKQEGGASIIDYDYPQSVRLGFKFQPMEKLRLLADVSWTNWSIINSQKISFDVPVKILKLYEAHEYTGSPASYDGNAYNFSARDLIIEKHFKDTIDWSVGIEWQAAEAIALRAGYERRMSGVKDKYFDLHSWPTSNLIGTGVEVKLKNRITFELGIGFLFCDDYYLSADINQNSSSQTSAFTNRFGGSLSYGQSINLNSNIDPSNLFSNPYPGQNYKMSLSTYFFSANINIPWDELKKINPYRRKGIKQNK